jgi:hypothetical protein
MVGPLRVQYVSQFTRRNTVDSSIVGWTELEVAKENKKSEPKLKLAVLYSYVCTKYCSYGGDGYYGELAAS